MRLSSADLRNLSYGLSLALDELHNQKATCPDVNRYAEDLQEIAESRATIQKLRNRVEAQFVKTANKEAKCQSK